MNTNIFSMAKLIDDFLINLPIQCLNKSFISLMTLKNSFLSGNKTDDTLT